LYVGANVFAERRLRNDGNGHAVAVPFAAGYPFVDSFGDPVEVSDAIRVSVAIPVELSDEISIEFADAVSNSVVCGDAHTDGIVGVVTVKDPVGNYDTVANRNRNADRFKNNNRHAF
jgi:hypothetical protein